MKIIEYLSKHYEIGMITSVGGSALSFVETTKPFLQYTGIVIGIGIGILTLYIKVKEAKKAFKN